MASVLAGDAEPGGRLPTTWPMDDDGPAVRPVDGVLTYDEKTAIGYRSSRRPRFPFGHGLGYTTWSYSDLRVTPAQATLRLRNTGSRTGREVAQVYVARDGDIRLAGFAGVTLDPGQEREVTVSLHERAFQRWTDGAWHTVPGEYEVRVGRSIADIQLSAVVSVTADSARAAG